MSANYERRPTGEAARRSGQDFRIVHPPCDKTAEPVPLFDPADTRQPQWTDALHRLDLDGHRRVQEQSALDAVASWWRAEAEAALERLAASGQPLDAERLRDEVGDAPGPSQNAFGALFAAAARAGTIRCIGTRSASRAPAAGHQIRVWIGTGGDA